MTINFQFPAQIYPNDALKILFLHQILLQDKFVGVDFKYEDNDDGNGGDDDDDDLLFWYYWPMKNVWPYF